MNYNKAKAIEFLQGQDDAAQFVLRTTAEEVEFTKNLTEVEVEKAIKPRIREIYDQLDQDILVTSGLQKTQGEKSYDYAKRVIKSMKDAAGNADVQALQAQIESLKKNGNPELLRELESVKAQAIKKEQELIAKLSEKDGEIVGSKIGLDIIEGMKGLKFQQLPLGVLNTYLDTKKRELTSKAKIVEGKVIYLDSNGDHRLNPSTYKPMTAAEILAEELKDIIDAGSGGNGAGTKEPPRIEIDKDGKKKINVSVPPTVKSMADLSEHLNKLGLARGTEEYTLAFNEHAAGLPLK
jgi:hypothetical protein